jgi:hypothetical protein
MKDKTFETIEILADGELSNIIAEIQELETEVKKYDDLQKQLKQKVNELIGDNKRAVIKTNQFELQANYSISSISLSILSKRLLIKPFQ